MFYAIEDIDHTEITGEIDMEAASGLLEVIDRESEEVLWTKVWDKSTVSSFTIPLEHIQKDHEYTLQFSATACIKSIYSNHLREFTPTRARQAKQ